MDASLTAEYPDPRTVGAREVLQGLRGIVEREQLDHVGYIGEDIDWELARSGALCRGHRACAVGSAWLAAGVEPERRTFQGMFVSFDLPGTQADHDDRVVWLAEMGYHGLRGAYVALCEAAQEYMDQRGLQVGSGWKGAGALEGLFETETEEGHLIESRDMLVVIDRAEELIA